jgi:hypothetical protein
VSGWIKVEKDLSADPRVLKMASRLRHADVTLGSRSRLVIVGAIVTLWWYADTHIRNDDTLPIGADQIDELVGLTGFSDLMPPDWFEVINGDSVKLIGYLEHNGTSAKKRAVDQRRQERHRDHNADVTLPSRSRHADTVTRPRPREDLDKTNLKSKKATTSPSATKALIVPHGTTDQDWFLEFKLAYPDRAGDQNWHGAKRAAQARLAEGHTTLEILEGAQRYAAFIAVTGKTNTEFVQQASRFVGPGKPFLNPWTAPVETAVADPMQEFRRGLGLSTVGAEHAGTTIEHEPENAGSVGLLGRTFRSG